MKKTFLFKLLLCAAFVFINCLINAQVITKLTRNSAQPGREKVIYLSEDAKYNSEFENSWVNDINTKAVRQFSRSFKQVRDPKWQIIKEGFMAIFTQDSIKTHVFYDKKGNYMNMVRYYSENKLLAYIRDMVKSNYYDYSIYYITEVEYDRTIAYFIKLEGNVYWKTIKIMDGEMEIVDVIKKAG